jgi:tetratricopeptide (TPR) repeat protein
VATIAQHYRAMILLVCEISENYYYAGRMDDALRLLNASVTACNQAETASLDYTALLLQHGKLLTQAIFLQGGALDDAVRVLEQAQAHADAPEQHAAALDLLGLAHYYAQAGAKPPNFQRALDYFEMALVQREALGIPLGLCETLFHLGLIHQYSSRPDQARAAYQRALALAREHDLKLELSYIVRHIGLMQQADGDLEGARRSLEESLRLREAIQFRIALPFSHLSLGDVCLQMGDLATANAHLETALSIAEALPNRRAKMLASLALGKLTAHQGDAARARLHYETARDLAIDLRHDVARGIAEENLAMLVARVEDL